MILRAAALAAALLAGNQPAAPPERARWQIADPQDLGGCPGALVFFDTGSTAISAQARSMIEVHSSWMRDMVTAGAWLEVQGPVDANEARNVPPDLSRRRAEAVHDLLVSLGLDRRHLRVTALGATRPLIDEAGPRATAADIAQNRNVSVNPVMRGELFRTFFPPGAPIC